MLQQNETKNQLKVNKKIAMSKFNDDVIGSSEDELQVYVGSKIKE